LKDIAIRQYIKCEDEKVNFLKTRNFPNSLQNEEFFKNIFDLRKVLRDWMALEKNKNIKIEIFIASSTNAT
jgi:hypothetical protein